MATEADQAKVAYEVEPKEINTHRRMPNSKEQFGKESKTMPQDSHSRYKEHR